MKMKVCREGGRGWAARGMSRGRSWRRSGSGGRRKRRGGSVAGRRWSRAIAGRWGHRGSMIRIGIRNRPDRQPATFFVSVCGRGCHVGFRKPCTTSDTTLPKKGSPRTIGGTPFGGLRGGLLFWLFSFFSAYLHANSLLLVGGFLFGPFLFRW